MKCDGKYNVWMKKMYLVKFGIRKKHLVQDVYVLNNYDWKNI